MQKPKLRIPIQQDHSKPITLPAGIDNIETPESGTARPEHASLSASLPELISISEAVSRTNLSYEYLRYLCYSKKINHIRCGRKYMIDVDSLAQFIRRGGADQ